MPESRRGELRVLLGAAAGVGKTYAMLAEGRRLLAQGRDVCVGIVETHGRAATAALAAGLPTLPRLEIPHGQASLTELDVAALLRRRPEIALVDELAHTNAPGYGTEKRWQDVDKLLAAGIDVITTLNVQHIESLNDVVEQITGVPQRETVPDAFLRGAAQIELVDIAPQALRDRLAGGLVYPAERIDAALANYFRLGNLTALRELALIWLADEVDHTLTGYRQEHGISGTWEARERVVVALTGGAEGETLLRRGARIAARTSGGELMAVHVTSQDGLRAANPAALTNQRRLVDQLGGTYHQIVGEDIPTSLVAFARSVNATQLVLGASRRGRISALLTGSGIGSVVVRESGDIDVHMVNHAAAGRRWALPRLGGGALSRRRRLLGLALTVLGAPLLTVGMIPLRGPESLTGETLAFQLFVVLVALTGGLGPALVAAVACGFALDFFFIDPLHTVDIYHPRHVLTLALSVAIAAAVSFIVDRAARHTRAARRSAAESELLQTIAGSVLRGDDAVQALLDRAREAFRLQAVRLVSQGRVLAAAGAGEGEPTVVLMGEDSDEDLALELIGTTDLTGPECRLLAAIIAQLRTALEHENLAATARQVEPLAASDRVRGALLSALGHDLRRPLATATAAVGGLRAAGAGLAPAERGELLDTAEEALGTLGDLVADLLDVSRLQAGALTVAEVPTDPADVLAAALDELRLGPGEVTLSLLHDQATASLDPVLLQRALVNLLANARRYAQPGHAVHVSTSTLGTTLEIRVADDGPGIPIERREEVFIPFQRLGDTDNSTGLGLGLALSRGLVEAMHGTLTPEDTPGGGLTMVIAVPLCYDRPRLVPRNDSQEKS